MLQRSHTLLGHDNRKLHLIEPHQLDRVPFLDQNHIHFLLTSHVCSFSETAYENSISSLVEAY